MSEVRGGGREYQSATAQEPRRGATLPPRLGGGGGREELPHDPKMKARGDGREELPHALTCEARGGSWEEQPTPKAWGSEERSYPEPWLRGHRRA